MSSAQAAATPICAWTGTAARLQRLLFEPEFIIERAPTSAKGSIRVSKIHVGTKRSILDGDWVRVAGWQRISAGQLGEGGHGHKNDLQKFR